jgi:Uma2 family endonuclease
LQDTKHPGWYDWFMTPSDPVLDLPLTLEKWGELDEDVEGELVDGRLEDEEMPTVLHEAIVAWLLRTLHAWVAALGGLAFGSELKLAVSPSRGRKPDVCVYLPGRPFPGASRSFTRRAPSIIVEVVSARPRDVRRDVVEKKQEYAVFGVSYYWLLDPQARTLEILELGPDGRFSVALSATEGLHAVPGCAGLDLDLGALWANIDALPLEE